MAGLRLRRYGGPDDLPAIVKVTNAEHEADRLPWRTTTEELAADRHRGIARALIVRSLHLLKERGMTTAVLGVDAENPSGALGLYERVGFAVESRGSAHRKPMETLSR